MPDDRPTRDKVIDTLKALPGVTHKEQGPLHCVQWDTFRSAKSYVSVTTPLGQDTYITIDTDDATLAEAVAALTPPAEPRKPTYEYVAGLRGAEVSTNGQTINFRNQSGWIVGFDFNAIRSKFSVFINGARLATPQTQPEVLATLKMCRVEVGEKCQ